MLDECLIWDRSVKSGGYGQTFVDGKNTTPHRVAWMALYGPIPEGMYVDHMCHNEAAAKGECAGGNCQHKLCYNTNHLRVVTPGENTRSGLQGIETKGGFKCGHEMIEKNIMTRKTGHRECAECARQRSSAYYYSKKKVS